MFSFYIKSFGVIFLESSKQSFDLQQDHVLRAFVKARKLLENFCGVTFNLTEIKQSLFNVVERVPFLSSPGLNGGQVGDQHVSGVFLMLWWNPLTVVACASALCFFRQFEMDETIFHLSSRNV